MTRCDLQRSIIICLHLAILRELMVHSTNVLTYGLSTNDQIKDGFQRLIVFTIVKITSTNKEIGFMVRSIMYVYVTLMTLMYINVVQLVHSR